MKVVPIKRIVNKSALEVLDEMRELVESGEVVALAICTVTNDGGIGGEVSSGPNDILMWSSMQHLTNHHYGRLLDD